MPIEVQKLAGRSNYRVWETQIRASLIERDLSDSIDITPEQSEELKRLEKQNDVKGIAEVQRLKKVDKKAHAIITLHVADDLVADVHAAGGAKHALSLLKSKFGQLNPFELAALRRELSDMRIRQGDDVPAILKRMLEIRSALVAAGDDYSERSLAMHILSALDPSFDNLAGGITTGDLETVVSRLTVEHSRRKLNNTAAGSSSISSVASGRSRPICEHCSKPGHVKAKCWALHGKPGGTRNHMISSISNPAGVSAIGDGVLDSGAAFHVTNGGHPGSFAGGPVHLPAEWE